MPKTDAARRTDGTRRNVPAGWPGRMDGWLGRKDRGRWMDGQRERQRLPFSCLSGFLAGYWSRKNEGKSLLTAAVVFLAVLKVVLASLKVLCGNSWRLLGRYWPLSGALGPLSASLGLLRLLLAALGRYWCALGTSSGALRPLLVALGRSWACLGQFLAALGLFLGRSWPPLGCQKCSQSSIWSKNP